MAEQAIEKRCYAYSNRMQNNLLEDKRVGRFFERVENVFAVIESPWI